MRMYPELNLYEHYKERSFDVLFSKDLPDVTKRITLEHMNFAVNFCEAWDSFLDIGGGSGHYSTALSAIFKKGAVVDISHFKEHEDLVKRYPNIEVVHKPVEEFTKTERVDFILLADLFEHIEKIEPFVKKLAGFQDKGGVIYIMTPNPAKCGPAPESGIYHTRHTFGHQKHYAKQEIEKIMAKEGYSLVGMFYEEGGVRQFAKRIVKGLSRRDKNWGNHILYKILRPLILPVMKLASFVLGIASYYGERNISRPELNAPTQDLVFKKI
jgi:predicted TPR repeat methyltransferase